MLDRHDKPLVDTWVAAGRAGEGRTDGAGRIVFEEVPAGSYKLHLVEPGIVYGKQWVHRLLDGETRRVTLREGPWFDVDVFVLDETGVPAQFARIDVEPDGIAPWVHLVDGVQTLTVTTDAAGRCRLPELPWVDVGITTRFGTRSASIVLEPGAYAVTLTLGVADASILR